MLQIVEARSAADAAEAKRLFEQYAASLDFDLCFQDFESELRRFPGEYAPPSGRLFLARVDARAVGCVGLRRFDDGICELKRLYVLPAYQGRRAGRRLTQAAIAAARQIGYAAMRLDTLPSMTQANALYGSLGFKRVNAYRHNPLPGAIFMQLDFTGASPS